MKLILLVALLTLTVLPLPQSTTITLNPNVTYQTITGWEAHVQSGAMLENDTLGVNKTNPNFAVYASSLYDQAVNDVGITRVRLEVRSGAENPVDYFGQYINGQITVSAYNPHRYEAVNDNGDPNVINAAGFKFSALDFDVDKTVLPMRQKLAARGETLWVNLCFVDFGTSPFEFKTNPSEYGEFVLATYQHLQTKYSLVPDSWEVILEPDNSAAGYSATQVAAIVVAAQNRLLAAGFTPNFVLPSTVSGPNAKTFYNNMKAANPASISYVSEVAYHRYVGIDNGLLTQLKTTVEADGNSTAMLEWWNGTNSYKTLHKDLKVGNNSAWQQGIIAGPLASGTKLYLTSGNTFSMREITKFTRQYFKYVRKGAKRVEASSTNTNFDPVAFRNSDGTYVVIVQALAGGSFSIGGLPVGTYGGFYTTGDGLTATAYNVQQPDQAISGVLTTSIPAAGVITIYSKSTPPPTPTPTATPTPTPTVTPTPTPSPSPTPIIILTPPALTLHIGEQAIVTARVYNSGGAELPIPVIYVPDQQTATCAWVNQAGLVTALQAGQCGISAVLSTGVQAQAPVVVTVPAPSPTPTPPTNPADTGFKVATTVVSAGGWQNFFAPRLATSDNLRSASVDDDYRVGVLNGFGFTVPVGATITGIEIEAEFSSTNTGATADLQLSLSGDGVTYSSTQLHTLTTTIDTVRTYGGPSVLWSRTWTPTETNSLRLKLEGRSTAGGCRVDTVRVKVYYF